MYKAIMHVKWNLRYLKAIVEKKHEISQNINKENEFYNEIRTPSTLVVFNLEELSKINKTC